MFIQVSQDQNKLYPDGSTALKTLTSLDGSINKLMHILNGNINDFYHAACWNCGRAIIDTKGEATDRFAEIERYVTGHNLDLMGVIETD